MTNYKQLCAELVEDLELCDWPYKLKEAIRADIDRARAALAEPEPEELEVLARVEFANLEFNFPSDVVLRQYCDDWFNSDPERDEIDPVDLCRGAIRLFAQAPTPIPVSERLPGDELCWWYKPDEDDGYGGMWTLLRIRGGTTCYTHWLPAHALPLPS